MNDENLLDAADTVREHAYAPYSGYRVGAAVLDSDGHVHTGCNVENSSYPEGQCAEANAIGRMIAAGGRRIASIAIVGAPADGGSSPFETAGECTPCGGCRQRILEFADDKTQIVLRNAAGEAVRYTVVELLPKSFKVDDS